MRAAILLIAVLVAAAQNDPPSLLDAARNGKVKQVEALLAGGANIEMRDRDGRTALMLAAQRGHTSTVQLLLAKGANATARDSHGWNPYMFALLSPSGGVNRAAHEPVLKLLPQPKRFRLSMVAGWTPVESNHGSCFMRPENLTQVLRQIRPDAMVVAEIQRFAATSGRDMIAIVQFDTLGTSEIPNKIAAQDIDATLLLSVEPGVECAYQADQLSLQIRATLNRPGENAPLLSRSFSTGDKSGRSESAANPKQYPPLFAALVKSQAPSIYWTVLTSLLGGVE